MAISQSEFFKAFQRDIAVRNPQILPRPELEHRIAQAGDETLPPEARAFAHDQVFDSVLRIVPIAIDRYRPFSIPPEELVGEAYETIEACIRNYSPDGGASFPSYVIKSLSRKLRNPQTVLDLEQPFNIPAYRQQLGYKIKKAFTPTAQRLQHEPSRDELYEATAQDPLLQGADEFVNKDDFEKTHNLLIRRPFIRIGHEVGSGQIDIDHLDPRLGLIEEVLEDDSSDFTEKITNTVDLKADISAAMAQLSATQQFIVEARLDTDLTYEQIAFRLGITKSEAIGAMSKGVRRLRTPLLKHHPLLGN